MITASQIDELFDWIHKYYPAFVEDPGPPSTRECWLESLQTFHPDNLRNGAKVFKEVKPPKITCQAFAIACRGGEKFLRRHLAALEESGG